MTEGARDVRLQALRIAALLLQPAIPDSMERLLTHMGIPPDRRKFQECTPGFEGLCPIAPEKLVLFRKVKA